MHIICLKPMYIEHSFSVILCKKVDITNIKKGHNCQIKSILDLPNYERMPNIIPKYVDGTKPSVNVM